MKIFSSIILMVLMPISIFLAQPIDTTWIMTISFAPQGFSVIFFQMIKYSSNEFIITGGIGEDSLYIAKVTSDGIIVFQKSLYTSGGIYGVGIDKDTSGNFYVLSVNYSINNQWQLIKFDASGDTL